MFAAYHKLRGAGRGTPPRCQWAGVPTVAEFVAAVEGEHIETVVIEVGSLQLPAYRVNTYIDGAVTGTFDGWALRVTYLRDDMPGVMTRENAVEVYEAVEKMYFRIVHGRVTGVHPLNFDDPSYYSGGSPAVPTRPQGESMAGRTGSAAGC